jgi:hypothetical protein
VPRVMCQRPLSRYRLRVNIEPNRPDKDTYVVTGIASLRGDRERSELCFICQHIRFTIYGKLSQF